MSRSIKVAEVHAELGLQVNQAALTSAKMAWQNSSHHLKHGVAAANSEATQVRKNLVKTLGSAVPLVGAALGSWLSVGPLGANLAGGSAALVRLTYALEQATRSFQQGAEYMQKMGGYAALLGLKESSLSGLGRYARKFGLTGHGLMRNLSLLQTRVEELKASGASNAAEAKLLQCQGRGKHNPIETYALFLQAIQDVGAKSGRAEAINFISKAFSPGGQEPRILAALLAGRAPFVNALKDVEALTSEVLHLRKNRKLPSEDLQISRRCATSPAKLNLLNLERFHPKRSTSVQLEGHMSKVKGGIELMSSHIDKSVGSLSNFKKNLDEFSTYLEHRLGRVSQWVHSTANKLHLLK